MLLLLFLSLCLAAFPVQMWLCLSRKRPAVKLLPLAAPLLCLGAGAVLPLMVHYGGRPQDDLLVAVSLIMISIYLFMAVGLAWLIYGIVKLVQRSGK